VFVGLRGQRFNFEGRANATFNVFSTAFMSINSRFGVANPATGKGTVMDAIAVQWKGHSIVLESKRALTTDPKRVDVVVDGTKQTIAGKNGTTLEPCVHVYWSRPHLRIFLADTRMMMSWATSNSSHINTTYLNMHLDVPLGESVLYGGLLGQTARNDSLLSKKDADFITTNLLSADAKTSKFRAQPFPCEPVASKAPRKQPPTPSHAVVSHE